MQTTTSKRITLASKLDAQIWKQYRNDYGQCGHRETIQQHHCDNWQVKCGYY